MCKPWPGRGVRPGLYGKKDFAVDVKAGTITCPAGQVEAFEPGQVVQFDPEVCGACALRAHCTQAASGRGRSVRLGLAGPLPWHPEEHSFDLRRLCALQNLEIVHRRIDEQRRRAA